jgi:hypothetical protein
MSLIDWSDPDEMLGLLIDYVADEAIESHDADRSQFLNQLSRELGAVADQGFESADRIELTLRDIHDSQPTEFASDAVMAQMEACIEELHRIDSVRSEGGRQTSRCP